MVGPSAFLGFAVRVSRRLHHSLRLAVTSLTASPFGFVLGPVNMFRLLCIILFLLCTSPVESLPSIIRLSSYAPLPAQCPASGLSREANGLSTEEEQYRSERAAVAAPALETWFNALNKQLSPFYSFELDDVDWPVLGLATSGGGIGSMLGSAGVIQALDNRDSTVGSAGSNLSGLYQGITYHTGTSTGAWALGALMGNEGATVTSLVSNKWASSFADSSFVPLLSHRRPGIYSNIMLDTVAKSVAGYNPTLVDTWGRLVGLHVLGGDDNEASGTFSSLMNRTDFLAHSMPYPIITALNVDPRQNLSGCNYGTPDSPQYEIHPYEFGSWDSGIRSFSSTQFMGSQSVAGMALSSSTCITGFDNMGFLLGASSNTFNYYCAVIPAANRFSGQLGEIWNDLIDMTGMVHGLSQFDEYAQIQGPFSPTTHLDSLFLVDGSQGGETLPLWPLLVEERNVSVIIAPDFSGNTADYLPDGSSLYQTFSRAQRMGFSKMPKVPAPEDFVKAQLNQEPSFFGCEDPDKTMIVYIPNRSYLLGTNVPWWQLQIDGTLVRQMVENGNLVATMKGAEDWPVCVGCAIYSKSSKKEKLPAACEACFERFCWRR